MHSIDYNLFQVLLTIYHQGSVSQAADKLNLTQPAVSHALSRLRTQFGDPLFERHGRKMIPSDFCQRIIADVEHSLSTLQQTLSQQKQWDVSQLNRTFNIAVRDVLEALYFPKLIARLQNLAPGVRIRSVSVEPKNLAVALKNGDVDLVLDSLIATPANIRNQTLGSSRFVLVCRRGHPIIENCNLQSYQQWPHVVAALKASDINLVDNALTAQQLHRNVVLRCENFYGAVQTVCHSDLIMTAPEKAAQQFASHMPIQLLPLPLSLPDISIHMYWWQVAESDPAIRWLQDEIAQLSRDLFTDV